MIDNAEMLKKRYYSFFESPDLISIINHNVKNKLK